MRFESLKARPGEKPRPIERRITNIGTDIDNPFNAMAQHTLGWSIDFSDEDLMPRVEIINCPPANDYSFTGPQIGHYIRFSTYAPPQQI
jgi:hypothetical protein